MKITYSAPVRSHHYPYAEALNRAGHLDTFISGFSRLSPRSPLPSIGEKLKRHDFFMTLYIACLNFNFPIWLSTRIYRLSNLTIDNASYKWARDSDAFIYYRTEGYNTTRRLHKEGCSTLCVMEEVNSHIEYAHSLLQEEYNLIGYHNKLPRDPDHNLRLKTYEEADCILCPSEFVRRSFILKGFPSEKIIKVNFGFPPIEISKSKLFQKGTFRLLYVGQLNYRKGLRYAIEAFRKLKHPKKEFIIVGPKTPITGLEKIKIPEGVIFKGILKEEALKDEYRRASVFILPSIEEGLALVQGEALCFGVPLLITTNTGGSDFITDGRNGFIVPPFDALTLTERLQQMADDKELLNKMSSAALETAHILGSWDTAVNNLIQQLTLILKARKE
jgi:alpha-maltose-1-phosphate synthase